MLVILAGESERCGARKSRELPRGEPPEVLAFAEAAYGAERPRDVTAATVAAVAASAARPAAPHGKAGEREPEREGPVLPGPANKARGFARGSLGGVVIAGAVARAGVLRRIWRLATAGLLLLLLCNS